MFVDVKFKIGLANYEITVFLFETGSYFPLNNFKNIQNIENIQLNLRSRTCYSIRKMVKIFNFSDNQVYTFTDTALANHTSFLIPEGIAEKLKSDLNFGILIDIN